MLLVAISALGLVTTYAALAIVETYSKRSALGCVYPIFILTWHLLSIVPAGLETAFPRNWKRESIPEMLSQPASESSMSDVGSTHVEQHEHASLNTTISQPPNCLSSTSHSPKVRTASGIQDSNTLLNTQPDPAPAIAVPKAQSKPFPLEDASPVQGRGKAWLVQLMWAIYYIAGTLVYTSIVAVTVIELFVWVAVSVSVTFASKFLAFFLCVMVERRRGAAYHIKIKCAGGLGQV